MPKRLTTKEFIIKASVVHEGKYDYSDVEYKTTRFKVKIRCIFCDAFFHQNAGSHLLGSGCPTCGLKKSKEMSAITRTSCLTEFVKKAIAIHGDKYDYSESIYKDSRVKIKIFCNSCNTSFHQTPHSHIGRSGCPPCGKLRGAKKVALINKDSLCEFKDKAVSIHGDKYDYSEAIYESSKVKIKIFCKTCNAFFYQKPGQHLFGYGCLSCGIDISAKKKRGSTGCFIERATSVHGDKYDYSESIYKTSRVEIKILCKTCNAFFSKIPKSHLRGAGCPDCYAKGRGNTYENRFKSIIIRDFSNYIFEKVRADFIVHKETGRKLELDFYCEELSLAFEVNGIQHYKYVKFFHRGFEKFEHRLKLDAIRRKCCKAEGVMLFELDLRDVRSASDADEFILDFITKRIRVAKLRKRMRDNHNKRNSNYLY